MSVVMSPPNFGDPTPLHWSGEAFDRASAAGVFDGLRVELIEGQLLEMAPMHEPHASAVQMGTYLLMRAFPPDRFTPRVQLPIVLTEARPLPDFVILNGPPKENLRNPTTAMLLIEVSDSTLEFDQTEKSELYAKNGLPEYWNLNLTARCLEVRRRPEQVGQSGASYADLKIYADDRSVAPLGVLRIA